MPTDTNISKKITDVIISKNNNHIKSEASV